MDIATIVGLIGAAILIALPMISGGDPMAFADVPSVQIVIGGSIMVVLLRSSLGEFKNAIKVAGKVFSNKLETP
jgi:chemotaxis protein MotA